MVSSVDDPANTLNGGGGKSRLKGAAVVMEEMFNGNEPVLFRVTVFFAL